MNPKITRQAMESYLYENMPLLRAMEARVVEREDGALALTAPLRVNHNHLGTAFGGSIAALTLAAGYTWLWRELADLDSHVVVRQSSISYLRPVTGDLVAVCHHPDPEALASFHRTFSSKGKARLELMVTLGDADSPQVRFSGEYVALQ